MVGSSDIVETKFPITWVITSAVSVILTMGTVYMKVDATAAQVAEIKVTVNKIEDRQTQLMQAATQQQAKNETQQDQINRTIADIADLRNKIFTRSAP